MNHKVRFDTASNHPYTCMYEPDVENIMEAREVKFHYVNDRMISMMESWSDLPEETKENIDFHLFLKSQYSDYLIICYSNKEQSMTFDQWLSGLSQDDFINDEVFV